MSMLRFLRPKTSYAVAAALLASCAIIDEPIPLPEGRWELTTSSFIEGGRIPGIPRATLQLRDGRISAFSGCNTGNGSAVSDNGRMVVAALATTRRACPEPVGAFEGRYFRLIRGQPYFRIEDGMLILATGSDSVRFRRATGSSPKK